MLVTIFVIAACQKICVARGAAPRPTTPTHFVPRPYPGICPFLSPIVQLWGPTGHLVEIFLNPGYVASPTNGYPPAPHPAHSPGSALPYHQVSTPPYHCITMLCHTIPDRIIPQYHQVSTCTPISHFSCPGLPSACSSTSSCFSFKGRACKLFCNLNAFLEDDWFLSTMVSYPKIWDGIMSNIWSTLLKAQLHPVRTTYPLQISSTWVIAVCLRFMQNIW